MWIIHKIYIPQKFVHIWLRSLEDSILRTAVLLGCKGTHSYLNLRILYLFTQVECLANRMVLETRSSGSVYSMKSCKQVGRYL